MPRSIPPAITIHGALKHYAETGMEGGRRASIDNRFNHLPSNDRICRKGGAPWPEGAPEPDYQSLAQGRQEVAAAPGFQHAPPCKDEQVFRLHGQTSQGWSRCTLSFSSNY